MRLMAKRPEILGPEVDSDPHLIRAAGVLVLRGERLAEPSPEAVYSCEQPREFLLLRRSKFWDLPKGHVDPGEDEQIAAIRELEEEAGLGPEDVRLVDGFEWAWRYSVRERQFNREVRPKRVTFYLAWSVSDREVRHSREHIGSQWFAWEPPHRVQAFTVDPLLAAAADWLRDRSPRAPAK